jgi:hypothetical protein
MKNGACFLILQEDLRIASASNNRVEARRISAGSCSCPDGYGIRGAGCLCQRAIGSGGFDMPFPADVLRGLRGEPGAVPVSTVVGNVIDRCAFMPCEEETPFDAGGRVGMALDFRLVPAGEGEATTPVTIRLASGEAQLSVGKDVAAQRQALGLTFDAFSARYLVLSPSFGSEENLDLLAGGGLEVRVKMAALSGAETPKR